MAPLSTIAWLSATRGMPSVVLVLGFLAGLGCNESALEPNVREANVVVVDDRNWGNDPFVVNSAAIEGNQLVLEVSYSGGCRDHAFTLVISSSFRESDPVQLSAELAHNANDDICEAWLTDSRVFELDLIRTRYQQFYEPGPGRVILKIEGVPEEHLVYDFVR